MSYQGQCHTRVNDIVIPGSMTMSLSYQGAYQPARQDQVGSGARRPLLRLRLRLVPHARPSPLRLLGAPLRLGRGILRSQSHDN